MAKRSNKFFAKKITVDGIHFDSIAESDRYFTLANMQRAGEITGLSPHPEFSMVVMGKLIGHYTADASYFRKSDRKLIVEDTKSSATRRSADYRLRVKLCTALYPNILFEEFVVGKKPSRKLNDWTPRKISMRSAA